MLFDAVVYRWLLGTVPSAVLLLKGRGWLFLATGVVIAFVPVVGMLVCVAAAARLATPNSWWARHRYDSLKMRDARERYADASSEPEQVLAVIGIAMLVVFGVLALLVGTGILNEPD